MRVATQGRQSLLSPTRDVTLAQPPASPAPAVRTRGWTTDRVRRFRLSGGTADSLRRWSRRRYGAELRAAHLAARPKTGGKEPQRRAQGAGRSWRESILAHNGRLEFCY